jgi:hypothetical protein
LFKRSPSISEDDALYCCRGLNCNHLGAIHNGPGISSFVAHLMVGNMYRICCFNVVGVFAFCFASSGTAEERVMEEATGGGGNQTPMEKKTRRQYAPEELGRASTGINFVRKPLMSFQSYSFLTFSRTCAN